MSLILFESFPGNIRCPEQALWAACECLSSKSIYNFIHHDYMITVSINGVPHSVSIDFVTHLVWFYPILQNATKQAIVDRTVTL